MGRPRLIAIRYKFVVIFGCVLLLASCSRQPLSWDTKNITGVMPDLQLNLTDENGRPVQASNYLGKINLLYFGYTHCPDVCPLTLATVEQALTKLGPKADKVRMLFVSVDPKRDPPRVLKRYVQAFGPHIVGLTGSQSQLQALSKRYRVAYRYGKPDADGNYAVYHSAGIFVFAPSGKVRLLMNYKEGAAAMAHDLKQLVAITS